MNISAHFFTGLLILYAGFTTACQAPRPSTGSTPHLAELNARATNIFNDSWLLKPREDGATTDLSWSLAPLFLKEARSPARASVPQADPLARDPWPALQTPLRAVYVSTDAIEIHGRTHARVTYLWQSPGFEPANQLAGVARLQAVRITLGSNGQPVIWEVLSDSSNQTLCYVARSLEEAARREHGAALPGCRYAIEAGPASAPRVVVARILEDGPVAMGPILYLAADGRDVTTLICRCMPAQAKAVRAAHTYDLVQLPPNQPLLPLDSLRLAVGPHPAFWPGMTEAPERLVRMLRLPSNF